jgi:hypothetical protein
LLSGIVIRGTGVLVYTLTILQLAFYAVAEHVTLETGSCATLCRHRESLEAKL